MTCENVAMNVSAADRFAELLARHGADPARWPPHEHAWMSDYRRDHAEADPVLEEASTLDAWLDAAPVPPAPRLDLRAAILAAAAAADAPQRASAPSQSAFAALAALWRDLGGARLAAPALAMALAAGVGLGWMLEPPSAVSSEHDSEDFLALAQFADHYTELSP